MFLVVNFFVYCELYGEVLKSLLLSCNSISCRENGYKLSAQRFLALFWWTSVIFYLTMVSKATSNYHELGYKPRQVQNTGHRSQVRSQGTGHRAQVTGHRAQGTGYRAQGTGHRS